MPVAPSHFPNLPDQEIPWPHLVQHIHSQLVSHYLQAHRLLLSGDDESLRLRLRAEDLRERAVPLLRALEEEMQDEQGWVAEAAAALAALIHCLESASGGAARTEKSRLKKTTRLSIIHTGKRGRPRKVFDKAYLQHIFGRHRRLKITTMAKVMGVHRNTLSHALRVCGILGPGSTGRFTEISDHELDGRMRHFKQIAPIGGRLYAMGYLMQHGVKIPWHRVRDSLKRVDALGTITRNKPRIPRRTYKSTRSNAVWHIDGHHKLIRWGIVAHGGVDGHDDIWAYLVYATNNRAETVLEIVQDATNEWGIPSRIRGDRGGENIGVAVWMIRTRGLNRGSFLWGSSQSNSKIERKWVELGAQLTRPWRAFFMRLEEYHGLDAENPHHLWVLHALFLGEMQAEADDFIDRWNHHPVSGLGSPLDRRELSYAQEGTYVDEFEDVHPDVLAQYYNVDRPETWDYDDDAADDETEREDHDLITDPTIPNISDLEALIEQDQEVNVRHEAIGVPDHRCPFDNQQDVDNFIAAVDELYGSGALPGGLYVRPSEWDDGVYEESYPLKVGKRVVDIQLPGLVWYPRAVRWACAISVLVQILE